MRYLKELTYQPDLSPLAYEGMVLGYGDEKRRDPGNEVALMPVWGAGMAQWLSIYLPRRLSTNVARVRFPDSASYVG